MGTLKEIENKYYKECNVIMLPTEDKSNIYLNSIKEIIFNSNNFPLDEDMVKDGDFIPQHLYITSDDEIKEGDWYINSANKKDYLNRSGDTRFDGLYDDCKKIIATTDKSLTVFNNINDKTLYLPQPSQAFIKKYCELDGIGEVDVEYDKLYAGAIYGNDGLYDKQYELHLKVDSHNTITIHPIKDSWNREEVETLLFDYANDNGLLSFKEGIKVFNTWIKNNL